MAELSDYDAIEINDEAVSLYDALKLAKLNGRVQFIEDAIDAEIIRQTVVHRGIEVSVEELQEAADEFRLERDLNDTEATEAWLEANYLSYVDWEALLEQQIAARKLCELLTAERVDQTFVENRLSFDSATISRIVLKEEGIARELRAQILEGEADFYALARAHSIDESTRMAGGFAGAVRRFDMEAAIESAVFGAQPGRVVGPLKTDDGWEIIKIESLQSASLDEALRATIKQQLFAEWLSNQRRKARITIPVLEPEAYDESESVEPDEEAETV